MKYSHYLALGDSISIDLYPSLDIDHTEGHKAGAASRLHQMLELYHNPRITLTNKTADGATIQQIERQANESKWCAGFGKELLITVTAGGNDISFTAMRVTNKEWWKSHELPRICANWNLLVAGLVGDFPEATIIVNTLYDPTDRTGTFGGREVAGAWEDIADEYSFGRRYLSHHIRHALSGSTIPRLLLADVGELFEGHGVSRPRNEQWYWSEFMIEPNAEGARQIATLWFNTLNAAVLERRPRLVV